MGTKNQAATQSNGSSTTVLSNAQILQQVIHEDFKNIVEHMRRFRVDHYDDSALSFSTNSKSVAGARSSMGRRWVVFY